jgi:integrase
MELKQDDIAGLGCEPGKKETFVSDDRQPGLLLRLYASGVKTYYADIPSGRVKLGDAARIKMVQARSATRAVLGDVAHGKDPVRERKEAAQANKRKAETDALTLETIIDKWQAHLRRTRRPRYADDAPRSIRRVLAKYLKTPAAELDRKAVKRTLNELEETAPVMAKHTATYLGSCYAWAVEKTYLEDNQFTKLFRAKVTKRQRSLSDEELRLVWMAAGNMGVYGAIVRMAAATGTRRDEVAGMTRSELPPSLSTWMIPGLRTKNHTDLALPLPTLAKEIIAAQPPIDDNPYVFPGRGGGHFSGFSPAKAALDKASGVTGWRFHDLRRTLATNMQRLGVRLEVTEALLNHKSGSRGGIVGVYQTHDWAAEKVSAMAAWDKRLRAIIEGTVEETNVTDLAVARAAPRTATDWSERRA